MKHAVKLISEAGDAYTVGGYGVVWGGKDLRGEWFDRDSDLWLDRLKGDPLLMFDHGFDETVGKAVLGHVVTKTVDDVGLWIEAQVEKAGEYAEMVMELVRKGVLGFSTGSVPHLVEITKAGYVKSWPVIEASLTATPCEPRTVGVDDLTAIAEANPDARSFVALVKALPTSPTPVDGAGGYPGGSYESLMGSLNRAVSKMLSEADDYESWCYVVATFPDYVVACLCEDYRSTTFYEISYAIGSDGLPVLGEARPVERVYLPVETPPADVAATAVMSAYTVRSATALAARVRVLHEGRVKEGRVLSPANRDRLKANRDALAGLVDTYDALLTETETKTSAEVGATNAVVEVQAAYARILATACGLEAPR